MRVRSLVGAAFAAGFVSVVVQASVTNQCPARELGACARIHMEIMRPRVVGPVVLAAPPMRAAVDRG